MAINAKTPKGSLPLLETFDAPTANDKTKVELIGPDATPPESNAIPTKSFGHKKDKIMASEYPGTRTAIKLNPKIVFKSAIPTETETPEARKTSSIFLRIVPPETSST